VKRKQVGGAQGGEGKRTARRIERTFFLNAQGSKKASKCNGVLLVASRMESARKKEGRYRNLTSRQRREKKVKGRGRNGGRVVSDPTVLEKRILVNSNGRGSRKRSIVGGKAKFLIRGKGNTKEE